MNSGVDCRNSILFYVAKSASLHVTCGLADPQNSALCKRTCGAANPWIRETTHRVKCCGCADLWCCICIYGNRDGECLGSMVQSTCGLANPQNLAPICGPVEPQTNGICESWGRVKCWGCVNLCCCICICGNKNLWTCRPADQRPTWPLPSREDSCSWGRTPAV